MHSVPLSALPQASLRVDLANMISEHAPPGSRKFNGALSSVGSERLPYKRPRGDANRGKESSRLTGTARSAVLAVRP